MVRAITFEGRPLTLAGRIIKTGMPAPEFSVIAQDLREYHLEDFRDKIKVITSFPSLDTPVCELQVREFNNRAPVADTVVVIGISKDLPFAQKRFCESFDMRHIMVLSDYKTSSFGINYGLLIKNLNLLARAVIIIDRFDIIRYLQVVNELTNTPDYTDALSHLQDVIDNPGVRAATPAFAHCQPCAGGIQPLAVEGIRGKMNQLNGWELHEDKKLTKIVKFKNFIEAKYYVDVVAIIAEDQGHHPDITINYNKVTLTLTTHAAGGLTDNDFIMATIIDELVV